MRIIKYLISGAIGITVNLGMLRLLVRAGLYYLIASIIAVSISTVVGFLLQKFWTFETRSYKRIHWQFAWYTAVALCNIALNTLIVYLLVSGIGVHYLIAQTIGAAVIAITSYLVYSKFIFAPRE